MKINVYANLSYLVLDFIYISKNKHHLFRLCKDKEISAQTPQFRFLNKFEICSSSRAINTTRSSIGSA